MSVYSDYFWLMLNLNALLNVRFNKNTRRFEELADWQSKTVALSWIIFILFLYLDTLRYLAALNEFTYVEIIHSIVMVLFPAFYVHFAKSAYFNAKDVVVLLNNLELLDEQLWRRYKFRNKAKRRVKYLVHLVNLVYGLISLMILLGVYLFFCVPNTKVFALQMIQLPLYAHSPGYAILATILLADRIAIFNSIIVRYSRRPTKTKFCTLNQLKLMNSLYLLSLNIGHRIEEFTNLMLSPLLGILILQAPTVFMIIMDSIFIRHGSNYNHSATLACYLLSIGFLTAALLGSTAYDMLRQSYEEVGRSVHKFHVNHSRKSEINDLLFGTSMNIIETKPKLELANVFDMGCNNFVIVVNSLINFAVIIMHLERGS